MTTVVPVPRQIPGFFIEPSTGAGAAGINASGQILLSMGFHAGGPAGDLTQHPVLLTPTPPPPTLTLKVNGQHPSPPIVTTTGPMVLTLDLTASAYSAPVSWYWGFFVDNQLLWVTATGFSTTPSAFLVGPPVAITNATLLDFTLPPGTTLATFFVLVDGGGSAVAFDVISATRL